MANNFSGILDLLPNPKPSCAFLTTVGIKEADWRLLGL